MDLGVLAEPLGGDSELLDSVAEPDVRVGDLAEAAQRSAALA
jgi:hypothetical protein